MSQFARLVYSPKCDGGSKVLQAAEYWVYVYRGLRLSQNKSASCSSCVENTHVVCRHPTLKGLLLYLTTAPQK